MPQKLCVVGLRGFPHVMGGIETHCEYLYPNLAEIDPTLTIVVLARRPYVGRQPYDVAGVHLVPVWTVKNRLIETALHTFLAVFHARFRENARLIHIHAVGPGLFAPLAKLCGMRVIATHHGADYERQKWGAFAKFCLRMGERLMIYSSNHVICVGKSFTETLKQRYPRAKQLITYIPNGIPDDVVTEAHTSPLRRMSIEHKKYILAVGRLVPEKGFDYLVEAFNKVQSPVKLVIVGDSDHRSEFADELQKRAGTNIIFAGRLPRDEVITLCRGAALFVQPSFHEGLPIAALEALGSRCPILLSNIVPHRDMGLPARHYFPVGDVAELALRLSTPNFDELLVDDPVVLQQFDWHQIAAATRDVVRDVADMH